MATITFIGAAQEVTGSCHLLESPTLGRILLDCGMHQGEDAVDRIRKDRFEFDPHTIDAVILSHAHLDHSGMLPKLVHEGFSGPIYCTKATSELLEIMLLDSVGIYERDLERENMRNARSGKKSLKPEFVKADVKKVLKLCKPARYEELVKLADKASLVFHDAGHILGSSIVDITLEERGKSKQLVFSGDLGKSDTVLMNDPTYLTKADIVMMEGTYGNRDHRTLENTVEQFRDILRDTWNSGGNVMIPAFAVGRTQELLFYLGLLHSEGELDNWQVILDSPMAIKITEIYDRWLHTLDCDDYPSLCEEHRSLLKNFIPRLQLSITPEDSMQINKISSGALIIAGSGMCTGGRIRHHFKQRIWQKKNTLIFVGFQAKGTLGRILVDGVKHIKLFREEFVVKANIETLNGFSAHAGQTGLIEWISYFETDPKVILVHGEADSLDKLSNKLWEDKGISTTIPSKGQKIAF